MGAQIAGNDQHWLRFLDTKLRHSVFPQRASLERGRQKSFSLRVAAPVAKELARGRLALAQDHIGVDQLEYVSECVCSESWPISLWATAAGMPASWSNVVAVLRNEWNDSWLTFRLLFLPIPVPL